MPLYGGIDLHANNSVIVLLNEQDQVIYRKRLSNDLPAILGQLDPYRQELYFLYPFVSTKTDHLTVHPVIRTWKLLVRLQIGMVPASTMASAQRCIATMLYCSGGEISVYWPAHSWPTRQRLRRSLLSCYPAPDAPAVARVKRMARGFEETLYVGNRTL